MHKRLFIPHTHSKYRHTHTHTHMDWVVDFRRILTETHSLMIEHSDPGWIYPTTVNTGKHKCGRICSSGVWTCGSTWLTDSGGLGIAASPVSKHPNLDVHVRPQCSQLKVPAVEVCTLIGSFLRSRRSLKVGNALAFELVQWAMAETTPFRSIRCYRIPVKLGVPYDLRVKRR